VGRGTTIHAKVPIVLKPQDVGAEPAVQGRSGRP
jgi:hypothetical protein